MVTKCTEVWFDELRLSNINDQGGYAANGRVDIKIADLGTLYMSGSTQSVGFGALDQSINERALSSTTHIKCRHQSGTGKTISKKSRYFDSFLWKYFKEREQTGI